MKQVIFDLSEVIILGLSGFSGELSTNLGIHPKNEFELFGGRELHDLLRGDCTEDSYIAALIQRNGWERVEVGAIRQLIRSNFHKMVPGTLEIVVELSKKHELTLLSDHAKEWVAYIREIHPFIDQVFSHIYFSCFYGMTKRDGAFFERVVHDLNAEPGQCLFIDDSERNIQVAASMGLDTIHFQNPTQLRSALERRGLLGNQPNRGDSRGI